MWAWNLCPEICILYGMSFVMFVEKFCVLVFDFFKMKAAKITNVNFLNNSFQEHKN